MVLGSDRQWLRCEMEQLYSRLFAQIAHQSYDTAPTCHGNTQQDHRIVLQKVNHTQQSRVPVSAYYPVIWYTE